MNRLPRALAHLRPTTSRQHITAQVRRSHPAPAPQPLYRPSGEAVRFQTVRFQRPGFLTFRRIGTVLLYTGATLGCCILVLRYLDVEIEFVEEEELGQGHDRKQTDEGVKDGDVDEGGPFYAEEDSLFIPLTWSQKTARTYYRGSDPEWQEFLKVARDKPRHTKIQNELVSLVSSESARHPLVRRQVGKDLSVGKYWLDITFPDGPPPEYERSGIEIGEDFIAWSKQKVSQENQWRIVRALWPAAAASGIWAATTTLAGIQYRRMKQALGWEGRDPGSVEEKYRHMMELMQKHQQQTSEGKEQVGKAQTDPNASPTAAATSRGVASNAADSSKLLPWHIPVHLPNSSPESADTDSPIDMPIAMLAFRHTLSKAWNPKGFEPPRGAFVVQGLVELRGNRGRMLLDVQSAYDPRQAKFVRVVVGVRNVKKWNQAPRGGP